MHSALYTGWVSHHRQARRSHRFSYRVFYAYLDLDELPEVESVCSLSAVRPALHWFRRGDHFGPEHEPLAQSVRAVVRQHAGHAPSGPVRVLTHLRTLGVVFNPVSFFYCFEADGQTLGAIVAEVDNTPWGERHLYVLPRDASLAPPGLEFSFEKRFHVSPFMPLDQRYLWQFDPPGEGLSVRMRSFEASRQVFEARLKTRREPLTSQRLLSASLGCPLMPALALARIYFQAAKLWRADAPCFDHPDAAPLTLRSSRLKREPRVSGPTSVVRASPRAPAPRPPGPRLAPTLRSTRPGDLS